MKLGIPLNEAGKSGNEAPYAVLHPRILYFPQIRGFSQTLRVVFDEDGPHTDKDPDGSGRYGHKIYGYLKPQYTGVVCM